MSRYCSVPQCSSEKKNSSIHFHKFPEPGDKFRVWVEGNSGMRVLTDRRKAWQQKLKIGKPITKFMIVCSRHFTDDDYFNRGPSSNQRKLLKRNAVPSLNLPGGSVVKKQPECRSGGVDRLEQRCIKKEMNDEETMPAAQAASDDVIEAAQRLLELLQGHFMAQNFQ